MFASALLLTVLHSASSCLASHPGILGEIATIVSHIDLSQISKYLPESSDSLHDRISQAEKDGKLYVGYNSSNVSTSIIYDETFKETISKLISIFFKDPDNVTTIVSETLKRSDNLPSISGTFELHDIDHKDDRINLTSLVFSPIKTDRIWNLYFIQWGMPYITVHFSKKEIFLNHHDDSSK